MTRAALRTLALLGARVHQRHAYQLTRLRRRAALAGLSAVIAILVLRDPACVPCSPAPASVFVAAAAPARNPGVHRAALDLSHTLASMLVGCAAALAVAAATMWWISQRDGATARDASLAHSARRAGPAPEPPAERAPPRHAMELAMAQAIDLADKAALLALAASIEAVEAREHGAGIGAVADELRQLAEQADQLGLHIAQSLEPQPHEDARARA
jgi:hypothetical protein